MRKAKYLLKIILVTHRNGIGQPIVRSIVNLRSIVDSIVIAAIGTIQLQRLRIPNLLPVDVKSIGITLLYRNFAFEKQIVICSSTVTINSLWES